MTFELDCIIIEITKVNVGGKDIYVYREINGYERTIYEYYLSEATVKNVCKKIEEGQKICLK